MKFDSILTRRCEVDTVENFGFKTIIYGGKFQHLAICRKSVAQYV